MPRSMPALASDLANDLDEAMGLAWIGEGIRAAAEVGSIAWKQLRPTVLQLLYELAYVRMFIAWEIFLEESFLRYLCGYTASSGSAALRQTAFRKVEDARIAVLGGRDFVSWSNADRVRERSRAFITLGSHETVIGAARSRLEAFAAVRNRIAHGSTFAGREFDQATMMLTGRRYRGSCPGLFLRDWNTNTVPVERWIQTIGGELKTLATQVVP